MLVLLSTLVIPLAGAGAMFALPQRRLRFVVLIGCTLLHLLGCVRMWGQAQEGSEALLLGVDPAGLLFLTVVSLLYCVVAIHLVQYTRRDRRGAPPVFLACHLFSLAAQTLACLATHWGLYWVAMETTTLATAPLLFYHHGPRSLEATWKFLIIGSVGIALALLGTLFLGMAGSQLQGVDNPLLFGAMQEHGAQLLKPWLRMATVFLVVGYGTKMGLAPMHTWKPDAYGEAPPPVAALLAGGVTNCAFLGLLRVSQLADAAGDSAFVRSILVALGLLSLAVSAACIVGQGNYRRLLAWSSVEHMGILALAVGSGATFGALLHALNNALNKGILFLAAGNVLQATGRSEVQQVTGLLRRLPLSGGFLLVGFLAATGFPPFGTFVSEFTILRGMIAQGSVLGAAALVLLLAVVFVGMANVVLGMVHGPAPAPVAGEEPTRDSLAGILPMAVLALLALVLGLHIPAAVLDILELAARGGGGR